MPNRLGKPGLIERIIIIGGIFEVALLHEYFPPVSKPETALIQMLVVIKGTRTHHENKIVFLPATLKYTGTHFPKYLDGTFVKGTIHGDVFRIIKYILESFAAVVLIISFVHITVASTGIGFH